uniref:Uncharacterized protein n=1 Tax=Oryza rufipogon TaxID=4529 RepID=A0A0E0PWI1_ORYRU
MERLEGRELLNGCINSNVMASFICKKSRWYTSEAVAHFSARSTFRVKDDVLAPPPSLAILARVDPENWGQEVGVSYL